MYKFDDLQPFLTGTDHVCTGEKFDLLYNREYDLLITSPIPTAEKLPEYYKSDSYISHTDSKKTFFDKVYQWVKWLMLKKKTSLLGKYHKNQGSLLDIGAGTGSFLKATKKVGWESYGSEPNRKAREIAGEKGIKLQRETGHFDDAQFDVISMWHVLEHVPDLENQLKELDRLLKRNGTLFIAVPNFKSYDATYYKEFWAAYDVPRHLWHFSKTSIPKLFAPFGFRLVEIVPLKFDAFYVSMLSEKHKHGHNHHIRATMTAALSNLKAISTKEHSSHIYVLKRH